MPPFNPSLVEAVARDHYDERVRSPLALGRRPRLAIHVVPVRQRAGWLLVHVGLRLALPTEGSLRAAP